MTCLKSQEPIVLNKSIGMGVCIPESSYVEALSPNVTAFRNGASKKVLRLNKVRKVGPWPTRISVIVRRDAREPAILSILALGWKAMWGHS